ncbi:hypothetical protein [Serratia marcescens]|uniref:hypothetical protein n=1 Tax=Serratia marcescens TaxID=615 RepID=UPI000A87390A|nr:hypothetical protein [Serratia marcescens]
MSVKLANKSGLSADESNGLKICEGNGVAINSDGVSVKLAKGTYSNGGEGQGTDGTTSGTAGGLRLDSNGLSVDAGTGMQINAQGVSVKLATGSGLSADEDNGLNVLSGNGTVVTGSGVNVKLAKGTNTNGGGGQGTDGTTSGTAGGLCLDSNGLSVDAGTGMQINAQGVSVKLAGNSCLSADETYGLSLNLPVGLCFLSVTTYNPNGQLSGNWSRGANIHIGNGIYTIWCKES